MPRIKHASMALASLLLIGCAASPPANEPAGHTYQVYFLGGQSNMEGFGYVSALPAPLRAIQDDVMIFHGRSVADGEEGGGHGHWSPLQPGHGFEFVAGDRGNTLSNRFGPELSFGRAMNMGAKGPQAHHRIAIVKYARGGTALVDGVPGYGSWDPEYAAGNGRNQYDNAVTAITRALDSRDIDGDGREDRLVPTGIVWMQGEADAFDSEAASREYASNLARLMALLRNAMGDEGLPVVIGRIRDSGDTPETRVMRYSPQVRAGQAAFVEADSCASLVTASDDFEFLPDGWHYTSASYVTLGQAFAEAMLQLQRNCG